MTSTQTFWAFWIFIAIITSLLGLLLLALVGSLKMAPTWSMGDALSEEASNQPNPLPAGEKPVLVASSSRLIAFLGLSVILCLYLGFGYATLWDHFFNPKATIDGKNLLAFLFGGATMFAPYMANQLREAFSTFVSPPANPPTSTPKGL